MTRTRSADHRIVEPARVPAPPRPLGRLAAVRVALRLASSSVLFLVGAVFLAIGLVFAGAFIPFVLRDRALASEGKAVGATVVGRHATTVRASDGGTRREYVLQYEFPLADGTIWAAERDVDGSVWNALLEGDRVDVRYDPADPRRHVLPDVDGGFMAFFAVIFPGIFVALGALLLRAGLPEVAGPLRLYRHGVAAPGLITGRSEVRNMTVNGRHPLSLHYTFRDASEAEHDGATRTIDRDRAAELAIGSAVTVLYDRGDPSRSMLPVALGLDTPARPAIEAAGARITTR